MDFNMDKKNELMCVASLAHHGLLGSVKIMRLHDVDLSQFPPEHLASLVSCSNFWFGFKNISGCDLVHLLASLKCRELHIAKQSLGREETQALVQAMESGVKMVTLDPEVTLDIEALTEYGGQGCCKDVFLLNDTDDRYREELRTWAKINNWRVDRGVWHTGSELRLHR